MMKLEIGVGIQQRPSRYLADLERVARLVGMDRLTYRDQEGLGEPRNPQCAEEMDGGPVGGSDRNGRIRPIRIFGGHPSGDLLAPGLADPAAGIDSSIR